MKYSSSFSAEGQGQYHWPTNCNKLTWLFEFEMKTEIELQQARFDLERSPDPAVALVNAIVVFDDAAAAVGATDVRRARFFPLVLVEFVGAALVLLALEAAAGGGAAAAATWSPPFPSCKSGKAAGSCFGTAIGRRCCDCCWYVLSPPSSSEDKRSMGWEADIFEVQWLS